MERRASRAARRINRSPVGAPVRATTTRSRVSQRWAVLVVVEALVDLVGDPEQGELAQGRQVVGPEAPVEGGVDLVDRHHVAVHDPAAQCLGGHVDQLHLVGAADDVVGHDVGGAFADDALDDVLERLQRLDADGGEHVDAVGEQLLDVLVAGPVP